MVLLRKRKKGSIVIDMHDEKVDIDLVWDLLVDMVMIRNPRKLIHLPGKFSSKYRTAWKKEVYLDMIPPVYLK